VAPGFDLAGLEINDKWDGSSVSFKEIAKMHDGLCLQAMLE
jgi:hypothetical protein